MSVSGITRQFSRTTNRIVANSLVVLGMLLWIWTPYAYWKKLQFAQVSVSTVAQIVGRTGAPVIVFHDRAGREITTVLNGWRPARLEKGQRVQIVYSAEQPEKIELASHLWTGLWVSAVFATVLCIGGWLMRKRIIVSGPLKR